MNQTQPVLLSQPHLKDKRTLSAQIALHSFGANRYFHSIKYHGPQKNDFELNWIPNTGVEI